MHSLPTISDSKEARRLILRRDRYAAQKTLWRESSLKRVAFCGRFASDGDAGVNVKASGSVADGTRRAGFGGLQTCGSTWACSVCSEKIQAERQSEVAGGISRWSAEGGSVLFGTLTMRHHKGQSLADLWDAVGKAWNRTVSGAGVAWNGSKDGVKNPTIGDKQRFGIAGYLRVVEVKHGANGWHVHVHFLMFTKSRLSRFELQDLRGRLFGRWEAALGREGYSVVDEHGIDLRRVTGDKTGLSDYFTKSTYGTSPAAAAYEVTGSQSKLAGKGGRTPFEILRDVVRIGLVDDLELWTEWEKGSKGRRQLTWSRGLRDMLGLNVELTDEEICDADAGGEVLEWLHNDWKDLGLAYLRVELLELAEADDTGEALCTWLCARQLDFADGAPSQVA